MRKKKRNRFSKDSKPVNDIIGLWETALESDVSELLGGYADKSYDAFEEDDYQPVQDSDDL
ncbi:MAG TPA: hypothetical protein VFD52_00805 [Clostridia bacterium]|nr:hypothetical protein [Clostridia bacterium]